MYATFEYYVDEYGGKLVEESTFSSMERKAEAYIRHLTYVRGDVFALENSMIKDAVCAAAEVFYQFEKKKAEAGTVKSENTDGYSVSYVVEQSDGQTMEEVLQRKAYHAVYMYLLSAGWLSRRVGVRCDHKYRHNHL